jgi:hypothetical protein
VTNAVHARGAALVLAVMLWLAVAQPAQGDTPRPWWHLNETSAPANLQPGHEVQFVLTATNVGDAPVEASASHVRFSYELPAGVEPKGLPEAIATRGVPGRGAEPSPLSSCAVSGPTDERWSVSCEFTEVLPSFISLMMRIPATVGLDASTLEGVAKVEGAHTETTELRKRLPLSEAPPTFGVESGEGYKLTPEAEGGKLDTTAGSHPFQLTTTLNLNETLDEYNLKTEAGTFPSAIALPRSLRFKLPPGLVGSINAVPECSELDFSAAIVEQTQNLCPSDTAIGVATLVANDPVPEGFSAWSIPVFNLKPEEGEPARFGFLIYGVPVVLRTAVPAGGEYGVEVYVTEISQAVQLLSSQVTLWGVPGDKSHDRARGWECLGEATWYAGHPHPACPETAESEQPAFLTLPTSCEHAPETGVEGESWAAGSDRPALTLGGDTNYTLPSSLTGCNELAFEPRLTLSPENHATSSPTGLTAEVDVPQAGLVSGAGRAESAVRETTVTLPEGMLLNPAAANGLSDCSPELAGFIEQGAGGLETKLSEQRFTPTLAPPDGLQPGVNICSDASKVGTVKIRTPLLQRELEGSVYLGSQDTAPFHSPLVLYLIARDPLSGVQVKLAGEVSVSASGRLTTTFKNTPDLPFEALTLQFFGGPRASLTTPAHCGPQTTSSSFVAWSGARATPVSTFAVESGAGGGPCPTSTLPFVTSFTAGADNRTAGAFSDFTVTLEKPDGQQALAGVTVKLPEGVAAMIANVTPCPEPPVGVEWTCGTSSLIGHATESSGLGGEPAVLSGDVFLTTGYDGAPFGLLVRTRAAVGPFDLGWVNVRSRIDVDPHSAAVSVTTDPGPRGEAIPTILDGVPVQLKALRVDVDQAAGDGRPFEFNPTNCKPMTVNGALAGSEGGVQVVSAPFTVAGCAALAFKPKLTAATRGQASRPNGASLTVRVTSGAGEANIATTVLTLPKALPSRQSTIRLACPDSTFEANPANCPEGSVIGSAVVHTPVLRTPLDGPAYLVSHGGAAFPDVEFVLQGEGIKLILDGQTNITKGITTSSFKTVPDAPIESFEAVLPEGPHSALGAYLPGGGYDLCESKLTMPTTITGQNGVVISQTTKIAATGCGGVAHYSAKKLTRRQKMVKALAACRKRYPDAHLKRAGCEATARARYGTHGSRHRRGRG